VQFLIPAPPFSSSGHQKSKLWRKHLWYSTCVLKYINRCWETALSPHNYWRFWTLSMVLFFSYLEQGYGDWTLFPSPSTQLGPLDRAGDWVQLPEDWGRVVSETLFQMKSGEMYNVAQVPAFELGHGSITAWRSPTDDGEEEETRNWLSSITICSYF
jgi:hypothetical protein